MVVELQDKGLLAAAAAKSLQSCPTLCNLIDGSPPGSAIPGILQARTLEWVAISFSNGQRAKRILRPVDPTLLLPHLEVAGFLGGSTNPYGH